TTSATGTMSFLIRATNPDSVTVTVVTTPSQPKRIPFAPITEGVGFVSPDGQAYQPFPDQPADIASAHWSRFSLLLRGVEPVIDPTELDPASAAGKKLRPELLAWLDRFFGTGG